MGKRYLCFTCYHYHPEMRGVSQVEFEAGRNVCDQANCPFKGSPLEPAEFCETCDKFFREGTHSIH